MLKTRIIPSLLLKKGTLVKTVKFKDPKYIGDPINAVRIYNEMEVDELAFLDITATSENRTPSFDVIKNIANECFMPFGYGGGIKNIEDIKKMFSIGAEKIIINTAAFNNPALIKEASEKFGSQSIVVSLDVKKNNNNEYEVYLLSGTKPAGIDPVTQAIAMEKAGAGEILLNSIDKDGTFEGYDIELITKVSESVNIPVIACGGANDIEDFAKGKKAGASALAAGSIFVYQGKNRSVLINYPTYEELEEVLK